MAIQIRRGAATDFDSTKMVSGELAVSTDGSHKVWATGAAGDCWELVDKEDVTQVKQDIAPAYSTSSTYAVGAYVMYNSVLYRCTTAITTAETWTAAHWTVVNVGSELTHYKQDINKCVAFPFEKEISHTDISNYLYSSSTMSASVVSGFCYTIVPVNPGETYNVSGYGESSPYKPFFASDSEALAEFSLETNATAPEGTTRLIVNGRPAANQNIEIRQIITTEGTEELNSITSNITALQTDVAHRLLIPYTDVIPHTDISNYLFSSSTMTASVFSGFCYTILSANPGETYNVSGYGESSPYKPFFASDSEALQEFNLETNATAPEGTTRLIVNGRPSANQNIEIRKITTDADSERILNAVYPLTVTVNNSGTCYITQRNYSDAYDFETDIAIKSGNNLPDIFGFYKVSKSTGVKTAITQGSTDFLSPSVVYAVNNMNGDFPDLTSGKLTGGWHRYNNSTTTGTATARNLVYKIYCDGVEVERGERASGKNVSIVIINRLQASNTEKTDGTGREVIEQQFTLVFDDSEFGCRVIGEITALEDIKYDTYFGVSTLYTANNSLYFVGCRAKRGAQAVSESRIECGDNYCTSVMQKTSTDVYEMGIDPTLDLGYFYANKWDNSAIISTLKSYMMLISAAGGQESERDSRRLYIASGGKAYWKGFYRCTPVPQA